MITHTNQQYIVEYKSTKTKTTSSNLRTNLRSPGSAITKKKYFIVPSIYFIVASLCYIVRTEYYIVHTQYLYIVRTEYYIVRTHSFYRAHQIINSLARYSHLAWVMGTGHRQYTVSTNHIGGRRQSSVGASHVLNRVSLELTNDSFSNLRKYSVPNQHMPSLELYFNHFN